MNKAVLKLPLMLGLAGGLAFAAPAPTSAQQTPGGKISGQRASKEMSTSQSSRTRTQVGSRQGARSGTRAGLREGRSRGFAATSVGVGVDDADAGPGYAAGYGYSPGYAAGYGYAPGYAAGYGYAPGYAAGYGYAPGAGYAYAPGYAYSGPGYAAEIALPGVAWGLASPAYGAAYGWGWRERSPGRAW